MVEGSDWRCWRAAVVELNLRGEDTTRFTTLLVSRMVCDSMMARAAAVETLRNCFPGFKERLQGFHSTEKVDRIREKFGSILNEHGV